MGGSGESKEGRGVQGRWMSCHSPEDWRQCRRLRPPHIKPLGQRVSPDRAPLGEGEHEESLRLLPKPPGGVEPALFPLPPVTTSIWDSQGCCPGGQTSEQHPPTRAFVSLGLRYFGVGANSRGKRWSHQLRTTTLQGERLPWSDCRRGDSMHRTKTPV